MNVSVKIDEDSPFAINIYIGDNHVCWQPFEPGTLVPWASKEAAQAWADDWIARNSALLTPPTPPPTEDGQ